MVKKFLASRRTGFYVAVTREGAVAAGDDITLVERDPNAVPVSEVTRLYVAKHHGEAEVASMQRMLLLAALPESWKEYFDGRLAERAG